MWNWIRSQMRFNSVAIMQCLVIVACMAYIVYLYRLDIAPNKDIENAYYPTDCFLSGKILSSKRFIWRRYRADFLVNYKAKSAQYNRWISGNGRDRSFSRSAIDQQEILAQYNIGETYPCWFDPTDPENVVLVIRDYSFYPMWLPVTIALLMLFLLCRHKPPVKKLVSKATDKMKANLKRKK